MLTFAKRNERASIYVMPLTHTERPGNRGRHVDGDVWTQHAGEGRWCWRFMVPCMAMAVFEHFLSPCIYSLLESITDRKNSRAQTPVCQPALLRLTAAGNPDTLAFFLPEDSV